MVVKFLDLRSNSRSFEPIKRHDVWNLHHAARLQPAFHEQRPCGERRPIASQPSRRNTSAGHRRHLGAKNSGGAQIVSESTRTQCDGVTRCGTLDALEHAVVGMNVARLTKEPTPTPISDADLAKIAGAAYGQTPTPTGWVELSAGDIAKLGINNAMLEDPASGFSATLYRSDDGAHVIAYRGTEGLSIKDWAANIIQGGGGIATQTYAVTFDAAGLGFAQKADAWNQAGAANEYLIPEEDLIRAYYNDDDILSVFQDISIGSDASGTRISVDANGSLSDASFGAHRVELLIDELTRSLAVKGNQ